MGWRVLAILLRTAVLEGTERFEEAEGDIAMHGILADQQCYFLAEDREVESPVGKQQHRAGVAAPRQVAKQEPGYQPKAQQGLHAFACHYGALKIEAGAGPLDQEALVLALHSTLGPMGAHSDEPQQGIEGEKGEGSHVVGG